MTKPAFTPGPWRVPNKHQRRVCDARGFLIAKAMCETKGTNFKLPEEQVLANAQAIAALPDLYAALEMVRDADEDCHKDGFRTIPPLARAKIDCALAKARGES